MPSLAQRAYIADEVLCSVVQCCESGKQRIYSGQIANGLSTHKLLNTSKLNRYDHRIPNPPPIHSLPLKVEEYKA